MADWADEIADALLDDTPDGVRLSKIAAAIRKAKADGMREAALFIERVKPVTKNISIYEAEMSFGAMAAIAFRGRAAEIEKGNA